MKNQGKENFEKTYHLTQYTLNIAHIVELEYF